MKSHDELREKVAKKIYESEVDGNDWNKEHERSIVKAMYRQNAFTVLDLIREEVKKERVEIADKSDEVYNLAIEHVLDLMGGSL